MPSSPTETMSDFYLQDWLRQLIENSTMTVGGCWVWNGWANHKDYGQKSWHGQNVFIHRKVYEFTHGVLLTTEQFACHTCDTRRCWNPAHLFLGNAKDNNNDCASKGRHHNTVKTHCKFGHLSDEANTRHRILPSGSIARSCNTCDDIHMKSESYIKWRREYQKQRRAKLRAKRLESGASA